MKAKSQAAATASTKERTARELVDDLQGRLDEHQAIVRTFETIFALCDQVPGQHDRTITDGMWEGLGLIAARLDDELETISDGIGKLYTCVPSDKAGAR